MSRIGIIENTGLIRIRLEKAFCLHNFTDLVFLNYKDILANGFKHKVEAIF